MTKKMLVAPVLIAITLALAGCGSTEVSPTPAPTESSTPDTTVSTPTTSPTPEAVEVQRVELEEGNTATLPSGETVTCPEDTDTTTYTEVLVHDNGEWECAMTIAGLP